MNRSRSVICVLLSLMLALSGVSSAVASGPPLDEETGADSTVRFAYEPAADTGSVLITGYVDESRHVETLEIPAELETDTSAESVHVNGVAPNAFAADTTLKSLTIAEGVASIGDKAFSGCANLESVALAGSVTSIGARAFQNCTSLGAIDLPDMLEAVSEGLFKGCTALTRITVPDGVKSIEADAFAGCEMLVSIDIPGSIEVIGQGAFTGSGLKAIHFGGTADDWKALTGEADIPDDVSVSCTDDSTADDATTFEILAAGSNGAYWIQDSCFRGIGISTRRTTNTAVTLAQQLKVPKDVQLTVTRPSGQVLDENAPIGTGCRLVLTDAADPAHELDAISAVTDEDILGSGQLSLSQLAEYAAVYAVYKGSQAMGNLQLPEPYVYALNNQTVSLSTLVQLGERYKTDSILPAGTERDVFMVSDTGSGLREGQIVRLQVEASADAAHAQITTNGLELISFSGGLSNETDVLLLDNYGGMSATYTYRVTAPAGSTVSFTLSNGACSVERQDYPVQTASWSGVVEERVVLPNPGYADFLTIHGPSQVTSGSTITLQIEAQGVEGITADVVTSGLEIVSFSGGLSDATSLLLLEDYGGLRATYVYRVTAPVGSNVSFTLRNVIISNDMVDSNVPDRGWQAAVVDEVVMPDTNAALRIEGPSVVESDRVMSVTVAMDHEPDIGGVSSTLSTQGLEFLDCNGGFCSENNILLLQDCGGMLATYTYLVTAKPGETVSISTSDTVVSDSKQDARGQESKWTAAAAAPSTTGVRVDSWGSVEPGQTVRIKCRPTGPGFMGRVQTSGLQFAGVYPAKVPAQTPSLSNEQQCVLLNHDAVVYAYVVTAAPGEQVSFTLNEGVATDGTSDHNIPDVVWTQTVQYARSASDSMQRVWDPAGDASWVQMGPYAVQSGSAVGVSVRTKSGSMRYSIRTTPFRNAVYTPIDQQSDVLLTDAGSAYHSGTVHGSAGDGIKMALDGSWSVPGHAASFRRELGNVVLTSSGTGNRPGGQGPQTTPSVSPNPSTAPIQTAPAVPTYPVTPSIVPSVQSYSPSVTSIAEAISGPYTARDGRLLGPKAGSRNKRTTIGDILAGITVPSNYMVVVLNDHGMHMNHDDTVGTGCQIVLLRPDGSQQDSLVAVVYGDVLGTGDLGVSQLVRMALHMNGKDPLAGAHLQAGDWNEDGDVTLSDLTLEASELKAARK